MDQDAPMIHAAKVVNHHPKLKKLETEKLPEPQMVDVDIY